MAEPRKVFRIEHTAATRLEEAVEASQASLRHSEIMRELRTLRAALSALSSRQQEGLTASDRAGVAHLTTELNLIAGAIKNGDGNANGPAPDGRGTARADVSADAPISRIDHELKAVVSGTEQATQKILAAAEEIDSMANTLSAALDGRSEQELAQDIQDSVIRIFEACNFQDLIGQRVAKVLAAVKFVEEHIARVLEEIQTASAAAQALHGPRLDGDHGHASQKDIDALFAGGAK